MAREMKDSGIEWVGKVPLNWAEKRIKNIFTLRDEKNYLPLDEVNLISLYTDLGVVQHSDLEKTMGNKASNADGYKKVYENDIIVNIILCWMGAIGRSAYTGVTSPAYDIYFPYDDIDSRFYHYYFRTNGFSGDCYKRGKGIMAMRWRTYSDQFRDIKVLVPPIDEQQRIADFLDAECGRIDSVIEKTRASIEEYKKLKQAIITQAVTRGIRQNRKMKDSGFNKITQIPFGWKVFAIKHLCKIPITDGTHITPEYSNSENGSPFLSLIDISSGYIDWSNIKYITKELHEELQKSVSPQVDDILLAKNGTTGVAAIVENDVIFDVYVTIAVIRANNRLIHPKYLLYSLNSNLCKMQFDDHLKGIGVPNLHLGTIKNTKIFVPDMEEQSEIIRYLDDISSKLDLLIRKKQQLLNSIESYKKSLIFEYVTGKKEVV